MILVKYKRINVFYKVNFAISQENPNPALTLEIFRTDIIILWKTTERNEDTATVISDTNLKCVPAWFGSTRKSRELPLRLHGSG